MNWYRGIYTGDPNAPDEYYQAALEGAGETQAAQNAAAFTDGLAEGGVSAAVGTVVVGTGIVALTVIGAPVEAAGLGVAAALFGVYYLGSTAYEMLAGDMTEEQRYQAAGQALGGTAVASLGSQVISTANGWVASLRAAAAPAARALSCFPAGTQVATAEGLQPIESIVAGQRVWAYDLITSQWQLRHVLRTYSRPARGGRHRSRSPGKRSNRPRVTHTSSCAVRTWKAGRAWSTWPRFRKGPRPRVAGFDAVDLRIGDELLLPPDGPSGSSRYAFTRSSTRFTISTSKICTAMPSAGPASWFTTPTQSSRLPHKSHCRRLGRIRKRAN